MSYPGPAPGLWGVELLLFAAQAVVVGEAVRGFGARWISFWRSELPLERGLLDFYLGGGVVYLVAALPLAAFSAVLAVGAPVAAVAVLAVRTVHRRPSSEAVPWIDRLVRPWNLWIGLSLLSAVGLYAVELWAAAPVGTGNTFDSSLLATYTSLLLQHGSLPLSFQPYASSAILYPQGTTVWLAWAQLDFGLPAARTSLLVTPLFLALPPLSGYVVGRRLLGSEAAGAAVALVFAWLGPVTRALVGGSNDLAFSLPLVLLLAARIHVWGGATPPKSADALGYGLLVGYSAALNPVGAEWLLPALVVVGTLGRPAFSGALRRWWSSWAVALAATISGVAPSVVVAVRGLGSPGLLPGAPGPPLTTPVGLTGAQLLGSIDPFLFRSGDVELSPIPFVRAEMAVLLAAGLALLVLAGRAPAFERYVRPLRTAVVGAGVGIGLWFALLVGAGAGIGPLRASAFISSGAELSLWLFTLYALLAALPLAFLFERLAGASRTSPPMEGPARFRRRPVRIPPVALPLAACLLLIVPGVVSTPTSLAPVLATLYHDFGNVSEGDFSLFSCAAATVPTGGRVLVAPGSAAEFLPGYLPDIVLLYPMAPGWPWVNASYTTLVEELTNGTLDSAGNASLSALRVQYIAVTGANNVLWSPFSPGPFENNSDYVVRCHAGDAYLFQRLPVP